MVITITEFKKQMSKYLKLSKIEPVLISKHGRVISLLTSPYSDRVAKAKSLYGILSLEPSLEESILEKHSDCN